MSALLLAILLQAAPQPATTPQPAAPPAAAEAATQHERSEAAETPPEAGSAHATQGAGDHGGPAAVIMHHATDQPFFGLPSKHFVFFVLAALLVILGARLAVSSYQGNGVPRGFGAAVEALVLFIRDEIAEPSIGHSDARRFTPLLCSFFFFILVAALLGLMPFSATSTGNLAVTMALALVSFAAQQYAGMSKYGVFGHFRNLVPPGMPKLLMPIMILVETIGVFTKPFALMIRLFANMLAGHMVITTLLVLIALMAEMSWVGGVLMTPVSLGLSLFIMLLEILVAFIQAYIFTLLTAIFIGMYAHPAH